MQLEIAPVSRPRQRHRQWRDEERMEKGGWGGEGGWIGGTEVNCIAAGGGGGEGLLALAVVGCPSFPYSSFREGKKRKIWSFSPAGKTAQVG